LRGEKKRKKKEGEEKKRSKLARRESVFRFQKPHLQHTDWLKIKKAKLREGRKKITKEEGRGQA